MYVIYVCVYILYSAYSYVYEYALGLPNFQLINYSGAQ